MKYRSRSEIIGMILRAANEGATKTRIMYAAFLSFDQLADYLAFLEDKGLIMLEEPSQVYRLTARGLHFSRVFEELNQMIAINAHQARDPRRSAITGSRSSSEVYPPVVSDGSG